jgi:hypothetical protein
MPGLCAGGSLGLRRGRATTALLVVFGTLAVIGPVSSASGAEFGIAPGGFAVRMLDANGDPETRAGARPDRLQVDFELEVEGTGTTVRDFLLEMPPGFGGDPNAVPLCPRQLHSEGVECPPESQVGIAIFNSSGPLGATVPIFQLEPEPGQLAAFASEPGVDIPFEMELRPDDYGITLKAADLDESALSEGQIELWGVPADHQAGTEIPRRPLLTAPAVCGPPTFNLRVRSWQTDAPWLSEPASTDPLVGCEDLGFEPSFDLELANPVADSPSDVQVDLVTPGESNPDELATAPMKDVAIELPPGLTVSPGGAGNFTACSDAQLGLGTSAEARCPASSRVGSVEFASPSIEGALTGSVFLGEERPGERFRMFVVAPGPGLVFRFAGALRPDPVSGRLTAAFRGLPQVAIERLSLHLGGGLLATPLACGPAAGLARFTPYGGGPSVGAVASVAIVAGLPGLRCPGSIPFSPDLVIGRSSRAAGRPTSLTTTLQRRDGEQVPGGFSFALPQGLSAAFGTIRECPEAAAASGNCPSDSRIGTARARIGSGARLATLEGGTFLAGPYRRAPFSVLLTFRAAIGPFDLGSIVVRAAADVDGAGRVSVTTDRLPAAFEGIPARFRAIEFDLDRPGLIRNPTSCRVGSVAANVQAQGGTIVALSKEFSVGGCGRLGFKPRIRAFFLGNRGLHENGHPVLQVSARTRRGDTNLRAMKLSLPPALEFDASKLGEICSRRDAADGLCPAGSQVGTARAETSMLDRPLQGGIFVVQPEAGGQPDLWASLSARGFHLQARGGTKAVGDRFVTTLAGLPDVPMSFFAMRLGAGKGILSLATEPCVDGHPRRLAAALVVKGQSGAQRRLHLPIALKAHCR